MSIRIKAIKDIPRMGLPPIKKGREVDAVKDYADKWIADGLAEEVKSDRKPIDIPKLLAKEAQADTKKD